jgi:hypothetical protein
MKKFIEESFDCEIDVDDDDESKVFIHGTNEKKVLEARLLVQELAVSVKEGL